MFTHNQILISFRTFSENHKQIHSFGSGDMVEVNENSTTEPVSYPQMWVFLSAAATSKNTLTYKYDVLFYDLVQPDESNIDEVLSDTVLMANDFLSFLNSPDNYESWFFDIGQDIEPFRDRFRDDVTGVKLSIIIRTDGTQDDYCQAPVS